jgi:hypothetical protein
MKYKILYPIVLLILFLFYSCTSTTSQNDTDTKHPVLFHISNINHAWGYVNYGWFIDSVGNVLHFNVEPDQSDIWHFADDEFITKSELQDNLRFVNDTMGLIDSATLVNMYQLIPSAGTGSLTAEKHTGNDMGELSYIGYEWNENRQMYKVIILEVFGDYSQSNTHEDAITLAKWLNSVHETIISE